VEIIELQLVEADQLIQVLQQPQELMAVVVEVRLPIFQHQEQEEWKLHHLSFHRLHMVAEVVVEEVVLLPVRQLEHKERYTEEVEEVVPAMWVVLIKLAELEEQVLLS
jgi:hypothetical protein